MPLFLQCNKPRESHAACLVGIFASLVLAQAAIADAHWTRMYVNQDARWYALARADGRAVEYGIRCFAMQR